MTVQTSRSPGAAIRLAAATAHHAAAPRQAWLMVALLFLFYAHCARVALHWFDLSVVPPLDNVE